MELKPSFGSDKSFVWKAPNDFADEEAKAEILGVRFATAESMFLLLCLFSTC